MLSSLPSDVAFDLMRLVRRTKVLRRRLLRWTESAVVEAESHALRQSGRAGAADMLQARADSAGLGRKRTARTSSKGTGTAQGRRLDAKRRWMVHAELWMLAPVIRRVDAVLRALLREAGVQTIDLGGDPADEDDAADAAGPGFGSRRGGRGASARGARIMFAEDAMERAV